MQSLPGQEAKNPQRDLPNRNYCVSVDLYASSILLLRVLTGWCRGAKSKVEAPVARAFAADRGWGAASNIITIGARAGTPSVCWCCCWVSLAVVIMRTSGLLPKDVFADYTPGFRTPGSADAGGLLAPLGKSSRPSTSSETWVKNIGNAAGLRDGLRGVMVLEENQSGPGRDLSQPVGSPGPHPWNSLSTG